MQYEVAPPSPIDIYENVPEAEHHNEEQSGGVITVTVELVMAMCMINHQYIY